MEPRLAPAIVFVDHDAPGLDNGTSWPDAYRDLQSALASAQSGDEIWIAEGVYRPTAVRDPSATFRLVDGVGLFGGFSRDEKAVDQRDPNANQTILSGDLEGPGISYNSVHVVTNGPGVNASLDGLVITGGVAYGQNAPDWNGGGILNYGTLSLTSTKVYENWAQNHGGGIFNLGELIVSLSQIYRNSAQNGGGVFNIGEMVVSQSYIVANSAQDDGGGVLNLGELAVSSSKFSHNRANEGGAVYNSVRANITHSALVDNSASRGAGIVNDGMFFDLRNSTVAQNYAEYGGGIYHRTGWMTILHTTVALNRAIQGIGILSESELILLNHTIVADNIWYGSSEPAHDDVRGPVRSSGVFNLISAADGMTGLVDGEFGNNIGTSARPIDAGLAAYPHDTETLFPYVPLLPGSPAVDAGNPAFDPFLFSPPLTTDQRGNPRVLDGDVNGVARIDIGAVESMPLHLVVTTTDDEVDGDVSSGDLSLREATILASDSFEPAFIDVPAGHYVLTLAAADPCFASDGPEGGDLNPYGHVGVIIRGAGAGQTIIDGGGRYRVLAPSGWVELADLTIQGGNSGLCQYSGGGIFLGEDQSLTLRNVEIRHNVSHGYGGAIYGDETNNIRIYSSEIWGNMVGSTDNPQVGEGGAIYQYDGHLELRDSYVHDNLSGRDGGGVYIANNRSTLIVGSTIEGNRADRDGGGLFLTGYGARIENSRISDNTAQRYGGGLINYEYETLIVGSIISGNTAAHGGGLANLAQFGESWLTLDSTTVEHNRAEASADTYTSAFGGGIVNWAIASEFIAYPAVKLNVHRSTIRENSVTASSHLGSEQFVDVEAGGGGIANLADEVGTSAQVIVTESTIENNTVRVATRDDEDADGEASGGGIFQKATLGNTALRLDRSTLYGNLVTVESTAALARGGALAVLQLYPDSQSTIEVLQSTLSGNVIIAKSRATQALAFGGGVYLEASATFTHSTIVENIAHSEAPNRAESGGGGVMGSGNFAHLIVANNQVLAAGSTEGPDVSGDFASGDHNFVSSGDGSTGLTAPGDQVGTIANPLDPRLGPLGYNGGPTRTHMPLPGSPVIDAGDPAFDPASFTPPLTTDQRGARRVVDGNGDSIGRIDIGAVEFSPTFLFADLTGDGRVDLYDLAVLQSNFGGTEAEYQQGDLNADGRIDQTDAAILVENFGRTLPPPIPAAATASKRAVASRSAAPSRKIRLSATPIRRAPIAAAIDRALTPDP